ncbi:MAG TPA: CBS domain-containing protein [Gaiellaceae bacterium]|jgi:CBS domain-containing protein
MPVAHVMPSRLVSISPDATVTDAVARMVDAGVGSVVVADGSRLEGIFTERDVLRLVADGEPLGSTVVRDVMTHDVVCVSPEDDPLDVAHLMAERRIRHAPIVEDGHVLGVVGIRDLLGLLLERAYGRHDTDARDTARDLLARTPLSSSQAPGA